MRTPAKRAGDEVATSGCSTAAMRAMTQLDSEPLARRRWRTQDLPGRRPQPMLEVLSDRSHQRAGAWREPRKLCSVAHGQIALSAGKSRAADRLLNIIRR